MESFSDILEAAITKNLVKTFPKPKGEQRFVNKHKVEDVLASFRAKGIDSAFNASEITPFNRKLNRFGRDEDESITAYESVNPEEQLQEWAKRKLKRRHVFVNGKYVGTTEDETNRDALKRWHKIHPGSGATQIKVAEEEVNEAYSKEAVDKSIASSNRSGRKIGGKEAKKIHALLKGWRGDKEEKDKK